MMTRFVVLTACFGFYILLISCGPRPEITPPVDTSAILDAVTELRQDYATKFSAGDVEGVLAHYARDLVMMPPEQPAGQGLEAAEAALRNILDHFDSQISITSNETLVHSNWVADAGSYTNVMTPKAGGEAIKIQGKYVTILKPQADGTWKLTRHMWNLDHPSPIPTGADQ